MKVTKEKDEAHYDTRQRVDKRSGGVKVSVGVVEGGFSASHANTTSTLPDQRRRQDAKPARCRTRLQVQSQADLDAFAASTESVRRSEEEGQRPTQGASLGIGGVKAGIGSATARRGGETTKGRKVKKRVDDRRHTGGLEISAGKLKIARRQGRAVRRSMPTATRRSMCPERHRDERRQVDSATARHGRQEGPEDRDRAR